MHSLLYIFIILIFSLDDPVMYDVINPNRWNNNEYLKNPAEKLDKQSALSSYLCNKSGESTVDEARSASYIQSLKDGYSSYASSFGGTAFSNEN